MITEDPDSQYYFPEAVAGKTGYLRKAGNTLVTYAEKDGRRLVSVILKGSPRQYFVDGKELLRFGFDAFYNVNIAENETNYVTGDVPVELNGVTYEPSELKIEEDREITLPEGAVFADAELTLAEMPEDHPEDAVGLLQYIYNERKIGQAYLLLKDGAVQTGAEVTETEAAVEETAGADHAETEAADASGEEEKEKTEGGGFPVLPLLIVLLLGGAGGGAYYWITQERKREAEAAARRREKRRQRLLEEGSEAEEEFKRLLEEKKNRRK